MSVGAKAALRDSMFLQTEVSRMLVYKLDVPALTSHTPYHSMLRPSHICRMPIDRIPESQPCAPERACGDVMISIPNGHYLV